MPASPSFDCDVEFLKLLARREDVDLTLTALELARDAQPGLDFEPTLNWIRQRAEELVGGVAAAADERDMLRLLGANLAGLHGVYGDAEHYDRPESSFLNRVIETKRGLPISLSILYAAVAERVGIPLDGVAAPMHFLLRYDAAEGPLFVDPFHEGRVLTGEECVLFLHSISDLPATRIEAALRPAEPRTIVIRMLNNLKSVYARRGNWDAAWLVQHRLAALQPSSYDERRDLGLISLRSNRPGHAVELLSCCLRSCPSEEKPSLEGELAEARRVLASWN